MDFLGGLRYQSIILQDLVKSPDLTFQTDLDLTFPVNQRCFETARFGESSYLTFQWPRSTLLLHVECRPPTEREATYYKQQCVSSSWHLKKLFKKREKKKRLLSNDRHLSHIGVSIGENIHPSALPAIKMQNQKVMRIKPTTTTWN